MKKETPWEFKDSLIQEIIKLKGLGESKSLLQHLVVLSEKKTPELISLRRFLRIKNRDSVEPKEDLLETELYIVINEETLNTLKGKEGKTDQANIITDAKAAGKAGGQGGSNAKAPGLSLIHI